MPTDQAYFERRSREEETRSRRSLDMSARAVHAELAQRYRQAADAAPRDEEDGVPADRAGRGLSQPGSDHISASSRSASSVAG